MGSAKPRILFLHASNELYGADKSLVWLVRSVADQVIPIVVLPDDLPYGGGLAETLRELGATVLVGDVPVLRRQYLMPLHAPAWMLRAGRDLIRLAVLARREHIGVVVTNTSALIVGPILAALLGRPHVWYIREIVERPAWYRSLVRTVARSSDGIVIAVSQAVADWIGPIPGRGPIVRPNGVDVDEASSPSPLPDVPTVSFVGRLNAWKGHDVFIDAAQVVHAGRPDVQFVIAGGVVPGDSTTEHALSERLAAIDPDGGWVRWVGQTDARMVYRNSWAVVVPSTRPDPLPNVVLEAMANGRAVVGSNAGGIPEMVVDGMTGRLVEPSDVFELAAAIEWVIDDPARCRDLGLAGRDRAIACFSRRAMVDRWRVVLSDLVGDTSFATGGAD